MKRPSIVPLFAVRGGSAQLVEPPSGVREYGFATGTKPPAQWVNFQLHGLGNWVERLRSPNRANYSRTSHPERLIAVAADTLSSDSTLAQPIRKLVAIDDRAAGYVHVSVRGDDWVQLTMRPTAAIGGAVCVCLSSTAGWYVGGNSSTPGDGAIWFASSSISGSSPIANDTNLWTICSVPVGTKPVRAIASNTATGGVIAVTTHAVLYSSGSPTTFAEATLSTAFAGPGTDVCTTSTAYLAVTATGQVFRATVLASTWTLVTTLGAKTWRLAADDTGVVVAYPQGSTAGDTWYVSTDHGLTWAAHAAPAHVSEIQRIRFVDGSWVLTSAEFPYLAESNDLSSTSWSRLPVPIQVTGSQHELCDVAVVDEGLVTVGDSHWLLGQRGELVAPGPWAPVSSVLPLADAGYLQGRAIDNAAPTAGQVLAWDAGSSKWKPTAPGGGGSLPAGTNGGVLAYAAGAWASTGAGTAGFPLVSAGTSAPTYTTTVAPLTQRAADAVTSGVTVCARVAHDLSAGVGAAGIGARIELNVCNVAGDVAPIAALDAVATVVTGDAEVGVLDVVLANAGGAVDTRSARFWASGVALGGVSAAPASDTGVALAWASRSIVVRGSGNAAWMDVWRVNGSSEWTFGTSDATDCGGAVLLAPASGASIALRRGSTDHVVVNSAGALTLGTTSHSTTLRGSALTIGISSVVAVYQGGARVPETTISSSATLDASHEVVFVDTTAGAVTLTLPAGASGRVLAVQRIAGANNVVVQRAGSDTIRESSTSGLTSWTISDDARHGLIYRSGGTEWVAEV